MIDYSELIQQTAARHGVPGAALGVLTPDGTQVAVCGITSARTWLPVQEHTLFQIGSQTKVWTATVAMQLAEQGLIDLDLPVSHYLHTGLGNGAGGAITMRMLLNHTSGLQCDLIVDEGRGDDVLQRYLPHAVAEPLLHEPGEHWTYCNAGFMVAGRVLEIVSGSDWDTLIRTRLIQPLGLKHTATLPEDVLLHSCALGHLHGAGEAFRAAPTWHFPRVIGPAGSICASIRDVLAFARMHLDGGVTSDGTPVLSPTSVAAMAAFGTPIDAPLAPGCDSWGVGWGRMDWGGLRVVMHTGGTIGQFSYLDVVPDRGVAIALLTNGGGADAMIGEVRDALLPELLGVRPPAQYVAEPGTPEQVPFGRYRRYGSEVELIEGPDGPALRMTHGEQDTGVEQRMVVLPLRKAGRGFLADQTGGAMIPVVPTPMRSGERAVMVGTRLLVERAG